MRTCLLHPRRPNPRRPNFMMPTLRGPYMYMRVPAELAWCIHLLRNFPIMAVLSDDLILAVM
eukprot:1391458-Amorphochlora_amoeboformis.AAC.2